MDESKLSRSAARTYAKICHEEGTVFEMKFDTEESASAFVYGFEQAIKLYEIDDEDHFACIDDVPAKDEE